MADTSTRKRRSGRRRRGRPRLDDDAIVPGSRTARRRAKEAASFLRASGREDRKAPYRSDELIERICRTGIPNYDPWADAEGYVFRPERARKAIGFFENQLAHSAGSSAGKPFILESWEVAIIGNLFGWTDSSFARRYREALVYIARKNGKTALAAGIILYGLLEDGEYSTEIYGAASNFEQASTCFRQVLAFRGRNEWLSERTKTYTGPNYRAVRLLEHPDNVDAVGFYRPVAADSGVGHSVNAHICVVDELHLQPNRDLVDSLKTSQGSEVRVQPLMVYITTADYDRPSICNEIRNYAIKVQDGRAKDPRFLPCVWEADVDDDWRLESTWEKANPNIDVSVSREYLRRECQKAIDEPSYEPTFCRLHCNIRTQTQSSWIPLRKWDKCGSDLVTPMRLRRRECWAGLDLAIKGDTTALVLVFPSESESGDRIYDVLGYFWIPRERMDLRERRDNVPYSRFLASGELEATPGTETDYAAVTAKIERLARVFRIQEIAYDRWNIAGVRSKLESDGWDAELIDYGQGFQGMNSPCQEIERAVGAGRIRHAGRRRAGLLRFQVAATGIKVHPGTGYKMPVKGRSTDRIDGVVALHMALGRVLASPWNAGGGYDSDSVVWI